MEAVSRRSSTYDAQPSRLRAIVAVTRTIGPADRKPALISSSKWLLSRLLPALQAFAAGWPA
jgi:hypothetical protein